MRLAALTTNSTLLPSSGGVASRQTAPIPSLDQQPPNSGHSSVPWLYAQPKDDKPNYRHGGEPPVLDKKADFSMWRVAMQDHLRFANDEMMAILEDGYNPVDPKNLTPREIYNRHLNDTAIMFLRKGMSEKQRRPFIHITSAKDLWDCIVRSKTGTSSLRLAQYEIAKGQLQNFCMEKVETPNQLHERLMTLTSDIESCDCDKT